MIKAEESCAHPDCDCALEPGAGVSKGEKTTAANFVRPAKALVWKTASAAIQTASDQAALS